MQLIIIILIMILMGMILATFLAVSTPLATEVDSTNTKTRSINLEW